MQVAVSMCTTELAAGPLILKRRERKWSYNNGQSQGLLCPQSLIYCKLFCFSDRVCRNHSSTTNHKINRNLYNMCGAGLSADWFPQQQKKPEESSENQRLIYHMHPGTGCSHVCKCQITCKINSWFAVFFVLLCQSPIPLYVVRKAL